MTLIGRELADEIDKLIVLRIQAGANDEIETRKRNITDSLLAMDSRKGVYLDDSKAHERKVK